MLYNQFSAERAKELWDFFLKFDNHINVKYNKWKTPGAITSDSDRDRLARKLEKFFVGKCFVLIDQVSNCYIQNNCYIHQTETVNKYSVSFGKNWIADFTRLWSTRREYLKICGIYAENELYGPGYLVLRCVTARGENYNIKINHSNLAEMQWRESNVAEFENVANLFNDDRSARVYNYKRKMTLHEMAERKLCRKNCAFSKLPTHYLQGTVKAKGVTEAYKMLEQRGEYADEITWHK